MEVDCKCSFWVPLVKDVDGGGAGGWKQVVVMEATGTKSWGKESGLR